MQGPDSTVLGDLESEGNLIATAMVGHDGRGWVYYVAVAPERQREGHARRVMQACEQWVLERHSSKIQLMVRTDNREVINFYETLGYETSDVKVLGRRFTDRNQSGFCAQRSVTAWSTSEPERDRRSRCRLYIYLKKALAHNAIP